MPESVYKVVEPIGTSNASWEKAAANAVEQAAIFLSAGQLTPFLRNSYKSAQPFHIYVRSSACRATAFSKPSGLRFLRLASASRTAERADFTPRGSVLKDHSLVVGNEAAKLAGPRRAARSRWHYLMAASHFFGRAALPPSRRAAAASEGKGYTFLTVRVHQLRFYTLQRSCGALRPEGAPHGKRGSSWRFRSDAMGTSDREVPFYVLLGRPTPRVRHSLRLLIAVGSDAGAPAALGRYLTPIECMSKRNF
jgi:hypothetical protein